MQTTITAPTGGQIAIGTIVTVRDAGSRQIETYEIDGASAPLGARIAAESPIGTALLGRHVGDVVTVRLPGNRSRRLVVIAAASTARTAEG